jgi:hypothetical protein
VIEPTDEVTQALQELHRAALAAFAAGATWNQALTGLADARRARRTETAAPRRALKGCPSEAAYRRHLKADEQCKPCRELMHRVEQERRSRHPEWWVQGAGRPIRGAR